MKKLTRKLLMSFIAVAFAIIALGTSTYAWFTLGGTTSTGAFAGDVQAADGIQISLDGVTYKNVITSQEMGELLYNRVMGNVNLAGAVVAGKTRETGKTLANSTFKFAPVTTTNGTTFTTLASDGTYTSAAGGYLEYTIYFRSTAANTNINLSAGSIASDDISWTPSVTCTDGTKTLTVNTPATFNTSNATKVSITDANYDGNTNTNQVLFASENANSYGVPTDENGMARAYANAIGAIVPAHDGSHNCPTYTTNLGANGVTVCTTGTVDTNTHFSTGSVVVRVWIDG
ncbi:MAG: hypothetical protein K6F59_03165, partial [Gammaproteobacteria bacterium]|nr:hypothetical protein [Gammaproteobacteria bacterium]